MPACGHCGELYPEGKLACPHCGMDADAGWSPEPEPHEFEEADEPAEKPAGCAVCLLFVLVCATVLVLL